MLNEVEGARVTRLKNKGSRWFPANRPLSPFYKDRREENDFFWQLFTDQQTKIIGKPTS